MVALLFAFTCMRSLSENTNTAERMTDHAAEKSNNNKKKSQGYLRETKDPAPRGQRSACRSATRLRHGNGAVHHGLEDYHQAFESAPEM
ncbi:hypothetical protein BaRGS_00001051 [Batillaria attramentaria]|uniref:Secreted protein n=1 Tax=Batillaria attramentaria TaxID=370345 RepID=A0ABD0M5S3_9CAEN